MKSSRLIYLLEATLHDFDLVVDNHCEEKDAKFYWEIFWTHCFDRYSVFLSVSVCLSVCLSLYTNELRVWHANLELSDTFLMDLGFDDTCLYIL